MISLFINIFNHTNFHIYYASLQEIIEDRLYLTIRVKQLPITQLITEKED